MSDELNVDYNAIEATKAPGVFNLEDFLTGTTYAKETVTIFTDAEAVNELIRLKVERNKLDDQLAKKAPKQRTIAAVDINPQAEAIDKRIELLDEQIALSGLTLHLEGMSPDEVQTLSDKYFTEPDKNYANTEEEKA